MKKRLLIYLLAILAVQGIYGQNKSGKTIRAA